MSVFISKEAESNLNFKKKNWSDFQCLPGLAKMLMILLSAQHLEEGDSNLWVLLNFCNAVGWIEAIQAYCSDVDGTHLGNSSCV